MIIFTNTLPYIKRKFKNVTLDKDFSHVFTGSVWALSARIFATGLTLVSSSIIARFYGAETLGIVEVLNSFLILATVFTVMGTNTSILRLLPEHLVKYSATSAFRVYRKILFLVIGVSIITSIIFLFSTSFIADIIFNKPHLKYYFTLGSIFIVFKSIMLLNTGAVRGFQFVRVFALMQSLPQTINLLLLVILWLFLTSKNVPVYALIGGYTLTGIIGWGIMEFAFKKKMRPHDKIQPVDCLEILTISMPMLMTTAMAFVIAQTGVIMLGMFRSESEVGHYAIAVKLGTLTVFILNAVNSMSAPKFSDLYHSNKIDELFHIAKKSAKLIFWTTTPLLVCLILYGKNILLIAFGSEFVTAYSALVILSIGQFVNSISGATGLFMNMTGRQKALGNIMFFAAIANILLNLLLIPRLGICGAALSAMASISGWNIAALVYIKIKFGNTTGYLPNIFNFMKYS